jgi:hypothetical protein
MSLMPDQMFTPEAWRIRPWIRIACVLQAAAWVGLFFVLGVTGSEGPFVWGFLCSLVVGVPYLALWPAIILDSDGGLTLRGWTRTKRSTVRDIAGLAMSEYGLRFDFKDESSFTSIIFQATLHIKEPRVFGFVEAITGRRPSIINWNPYDVLADDGIDLLARDTSAPDATGSTTLVPGRFGEIDPAAWPPAELTQTVDMLEFFVRELVGNRAEVTRISVARGWLQTLEIRPYNQFAREVHIVCDQNFAVVMGNHGCSWMMGYSDAEVRLAHQLVEDVVFGRIVERSALGRSRVTLTHADGAKTWATNYDGCLVVLIPLPGWPRWGRLTTFEPY